VREIAEAKMKDLIATPSKAAMKMVELSRSMGVEVAGNGHGNWKTFEEGPRGCRPRKALSARGGIKMVKERAKSKFDETIEIAMNLGVDPPMPIRWCVRGDAADAPAAPCGRRVRARRQGEEAKRRAPTWSAPRTWLKGAGRPDRFRSLHRHADMMPLVGRLGKVLGRRHDANPKIGTVTMDIANAVKGAKGGSWNSASRSGIVQAGIGKASFSEDKLVQKSRRSPTRSQGEAFGLQGHYIQRVAVSSTMAGVKVEPGSCSARLDRNYNASGRTGKNLFRPLY